MLARSLRKFRLDLEPCGGWTHPRFFYFDALDEDDAEQQALTTLGHNAVNGFGAWTEIVSASVHQSVRVPSSGDRQLGHSEPVPPLTLNRFARSDSGWVIAYVGKEIRLGPLTGLEQILHLLRRPGEEVRASALRPQPGTPENEQKVAMYKRERLDLRRSGSRLPPDAKRRPALRAYHAYREELKDLLERATESGDPEPVQDLTAKIRGIDDNIRNLRSEQNDPEIESARKAAWATIKRAINAIDNQHPVLARHLSASIKLRSTCCYKPEGGPVAWEFD